MTDSNNDTKMSTPKEEASNTNTSTSTNTKIPSNRQLITEGSISMLYPTGVVFYNPVQVQNRDLSLIMIQLYSERYYKNIVMNMKKKELLTIAREERRKKKLELELDSKSDSKSKDGGNKVDKAERIENNNGHMNEINSKLDQFEKSTDWKKLYHETQTMAQMQKDQKDNNNNDNNNNTNCQFHLQLPKKQPNIKGIRILDALAASGLRSLRYYNELNHNLIQSITINDLDKAAIDLAKENIEYNQLSHAVGSDDTDGNCNSNSNGNGNGNTKGPKIYFENEDATHLMYMSRRKPNPYSSIPTTTLNTSKYPKFDQYDVIDLDPYGSASPFLDSALQSIADGGMIAVTCTDMKTLGGSQSDTCYARYGSMPINKSPYLQELALRILLSDIAKRASSYGRNIKPILSVGMAFYVRVFLEVHSHGPSVKNLSCNIGTVYQSVRCPSFHVVPDGQCSVKNVNVIQPTRAPLMEKCNETGGTFKTAGPIWLGPLHDDDIVQEAIGRMENWMDDKEKAAKKSAVDNADKNVDEKVDNDDNDNDDDNVKKEFENVKMGKEIHGLLTSVSEELNDVPLYYVLPDLCHTLGCPTPPMKKFKAALLNAGYKVSGYHKEPQAVKTDAPTHVVWDILRVWCKEFPPKKNSKKRENKKKRRKKNNGGDVDGTEEKGKTKEDSNGETEGGDVDDTIGKKEIPMSAGEMILAVEPTINVDFTIPDKLKVKKRVCRFPMNPEAHWGPKKAASGYKRKADDDEKKS